MFSQNVFFESSTVTTENIAFSTSIHFHKIKQKLHITICYRDFDFEDFFLPSHSY